VKSISRNATINLVGAVVPMFVTLATVPPYLRLIGDVRFGVLALVWLFLGYFGLFEMGLGRATSKYIAELGEAKPAERESVFWTASLVNLALGVLGGLLLWVVARATLPLWLKSTSTMQAEVASALPWLALAVPVATLTSVLIGALEGCEEFAVVNVQQVGATMVFQIVPLAVAYWAGPRLDLLIAASVLARAAANLPLLFSCARHIPLRGLPHVERAWSRRLLGYGAWITLSGVIGPILTSLDRFVISFVQGAQALTYYTIPYNFANKLAVIPGSLTRALFPRFSGHGPSEAKEMGARSVLALAGVLTPIVVVAVLTTNPFFRLWIGPTVAARCTRAGELILVGAWINGLAWVPFNLLQAQGRPDLTAKFHAAELVPFVALLWVGVHFGGVTGAALVWCLRVLADAALLLGATDILRPIFLRLLPSIALIGLSFAATALLGEHVAERGLAVLVLGLASIVVTHVMSPEVTRFAVRHFLGLVRRNRIDAIPEVGA
jgi:O-antigen/teichoic acid export membrane protein